MDTSKPINELYTLYFCDEIISEEDERKEFVVMGEDNVKSYH